MKMCHDKNCAAAVKLVEQVFKNASRDPKTIQQIWETFQHRPTNWVKQLPIENLYQQKVGLLALS